MINFFDILFSLSLSLIVAWCILSHRVRDGVVMKVGLIMVSIGLFADALLAIQGTRGDATQMTDLCVRLGFIICSIAYYHRRSRRPARRASDWIDTRGATQ